MEVYSSRVQVAFILRDHLGSTQRSLNGVRICLDLYFTGLTISCVLTKQEKMTVFHSSLQAENYFGQVLFKPEVCKRFVTLLYCMSTSPVCNSVMVSPVGGSTFKFKC